MTNIKIAIINHSTAVSDKQVASAVGAFQKQVTADFAPVWGLNADITVVHSGRQVPPNAWQLLVLDDADQADALGYHDVTPLGLPLMKVFASTANQDGVSWTSVASHEILEALADPYIDSTVFIETDAHNGRLWPMEICDPVEGDLYTIGNVEVSNFVTPHWFTPDPPAGAVFDHLKLTNQPFEIRPNGYMQYYDVSNGSGWQQINEDRHPGLGD